MSFKGAVQLRPYFPHVGEVSRGKVEIIQQKCSYLASHIQEGLPGHIMVLSEELCIAWTPL